MTPKRIGYIKHENLEAGKPIRDPPEGTGQGAAAAAAAADDAEEEEITKATRAWE